MLDCLGLGCDNLHLLQSVNGGLHSECGRSATMNGSWWNYVSSQAPPATSFRQPRHFQMPTAWRLMAVYEAIVIGGYLSAEGAGVSGVLRFFEFLDHLPERGTISRPEFAADSDLSSSLAHIVSFDK